MMPSICHPGGSNAKMVYFRPPNIPPDLKFPRYARKDAADFVPIPKHMHFFPHSAAVCNCSPWVVITNRREIKCTCLFKKHTSSLAADWEPP